MNEERNLYRKAKGQVKVSWLNWVIGVGFVLMVALIIYLAVTTKGLTVRFETYGGSPVPQQFVKYNEPVTRPPDPELNARDFAGWYKDEQYRNAWDFGWDTVQQDLVLHAKWE